MNSLKSHAFVVVLFLFSLLGYLVISYGINRAQFGVFITAYGVLFACYYFTIREVDSTSDLKWMIGAALLFRLMLIPALPNLSDDFYRFIWDGNLLAHGINPFAHAPKFYMQQGLPNFLTNSLYQHLNSQPYYSVYPPVCQYIYALSAAIFGTQLTGNVMVMKGVVVLFEISTLGVMKKLLDYFNLSEKWLLFYALNPLIILEITGNLHFEGVMIFFLLAAYYLFLTGRFWLAAACFTLAVNTKLLPLILLPYLFFSLGWRRFFALCGILIGGTFLLHVPFLDHAFFSHFGQSLQLYFHSFEFNASLFYLVRWIGFQVKGYNIIHTAAPVMGFIAAAIIIALSWKYRQKSLKNLPKMYIVFLAIYYLFSTIVHPWYITSLVAFVPLTGFLFPLAWSALIPLTYITYATSAYTENIWLVVLEYSIVFAVMIYDRKRRDEPICRKFKEWLRLGSTRNGN